MSPTVKQANDAVRPVRLVGPRKDQGLHPVSEVWVEGGLQWVVISEGNI